MIITKEGRLWSVWGGQPSYLDQMVIQSEESYQRADPMYQWDAANINGWIGHELRKHNGKRVRITVEVLDEEETNEH